MKEAIDSVLNQTYLNIELIVVDDGSTVDLSIIFKEYKNKIFLIRHDKNRGLAAALNTGLKEAKGEFIGIMCDDDIYASKKIETQIKIFKDEPDIDIIYTDYGKIKNGRIIIGHSQLRQEDLNRRRYADNLYFALLEGNFIDAISPLVRRECYEEVGGYDECLKNFEDWDMWLRMAKAGFGFYYLNEPLIFARKHDEHKSRDPKRNMQQQIRVLYKVFKNEQFNKNDKKMYANIFIDHAYTAYRNKNYQDYVKYILWGLHFNKSRATFKTIRRLIKSYILFKFFRVGVQI